MTVCPVSGGIQIDGLHLDDTLLMIGAVGVDAEGNKHPLGVVEGATERSLLEGLDAILTVTRLGLPLELRRSLASTNIIESMNSVIRQVCRNVKR